MKQFGLALVIATGLSAGVTNVGQAATKYPSASFITTHTYDLSLDATGSSIVPPVGAVIITSNSKADTLTYRFSLTNGGRLTGVFLDAGGGIAPRDLGSVTNSLGVFTDSFAAHGRAFSVTFRRTDLANFTIFNAFTEIFAGVETTEGRFADDLVIHPLSDPTVVPVPGALPLFVSGLGAVGLLGWRRKRQAQLASG